MKKWVLCAMLAGVAILCSTARGYELATHARLTHRGYVQSRLNQHPPTRGALALPEGSFTKLGAYYCDLSNDGACRPRSALNFDWNNDKFPSFTDVDNEVVRELPLGWMMRGAVREDDAGRTVNTWPIVDDPNPQDDPDSAVTALNRFCNHFLDPLNNQPLRSAFSEVLCLADNSTSAGVWALGKQGPFATPFTTSEDKSRRNHFTIYDAREAMWRALTLTEWRDGSPRAIYADSAAAWAERARNRYWATVFRALGDVVHLVQDMGQPQHTRNEMHFGPPHNLFEKYLNRRAIGYTEHNVSIEIDEETILHSTPLPWPTYDGYPTPQFRYLSDYWSTGSREDSLRGQGLANYSNRGFFTQAGNINNSYYAHPSPYAMTYRPTHDRTPKGALREYLDGEVADTLTDQTDTIHMVRKGLLHDTFTSLFGSAGVAGAGTYSLDRMVFDEQAKLLVPRAVGYSAGVIDHFFRGAMEISMSELNAYAIVDHGLFAPGQVYSGTSPETGWKGFDKIRLRLKNTTPAIRLASGSVVPQPMDNGRVVAVVKFRRNLCYKDDLGGELTVLASLPACRSQIEEVVSSGFGTGPTGGDVRSVPFETRDQPDGIELVFRFADKQIPINAWGVILQVVYRGRLGDDDDAVVVASKDISEPTFIHFFDMSDCSMVDPPGSECTANGEPGIRYQADLFLQPKFPLRPNQYGIALSLGWPSAPARRSENFPGRLVRIAGLFDLDTQIEMRRYVLKDYYPPDEDPTSHAVFVNPYLVQTGYDALAAEVSQVCELRFREVPVNDLASVMWWTPDVENPFSEGITEANSPITLRDYFASRRARVRYPTPVPILNW